MHVVQMQGRVYREYIKNIWGFPYRMPLSDRSEGFYVIESFLMIYVGNYIYIYKGLYLNL